MSSGDAIDPSPAARYRTTSFPTSLVWNPESDMYWFSEFRGQIRVLDLHAF